MLGFSMPAQAQRGGTHIGKINLHTLFLLHPSMISYSPEKQAFRVTRDSVSQARVKSLASANDNEIKRLQALMKTITARIREEEKSYSRKIDEYNQKYLSKITQLATGEAGMNRLNHRLATTNAEVSHGAKMTAYYAQYSDAEEKLMKLTQFGFNEGYTTPEETEQRFVNIINEIKAYTQRIADQKGISIVLNTGYKRSLGKISSSPDGFVPDDMALSSIFSRGFPADLARDEAAIGGYYSNIDSLTQNWLKNGDKILSRTKSSMLDNDVFIGGVDLTADVLTSLFKAYKLDPNISNAVVRSAVSY